MDDGFGAGGKGFVVAGQGAVEHQPVVGPLDRPAFRDRGESSGPGGAWGGFEGDAEGGGVFDEVFAVAAVGSDFADRGMVRGDLFEQVGAGHGVLHSGRGDQHGQE